MDDVIKAIRQKYAGNLTTDKRTSGPDILRVPLDQPLFNGMYINGEQEPKKREIEDAFMTIGVDVVSLDKSFVAATKRCETILSNGLTRIQAAQETAKKAERRLKDVNILCGFFDDFDTVKPLDNSCFGGKFGAIDDNTFCAYYSDRELVPLTIAGIEGNGSDTAIDRANIVDGNPLSAYEYRSDNKTTTCTIRVKADDAFTMLRLYSDNTLYMDSAADSQDGVLFTNRVIRPIIVSGDDALYNGNYYGAGIVGLPSTKDAQIGLRTDGTIHINELVAACASYAITTTMNSIELVSSPMKSIAIFASEYTPEHFINNQYIKYVLTVNGKDYNIQPINSQRNGIKIIRQGTAGETDTSVQTISDPIVNAHLTIVINAPSTDETPFVSDIKVCLGGDSIV